MNKNKSIDYILTKNVYDLFNNNILRKIPHFLGLIPYEFYVIPGMYIAILQVLWLGTPNPIQFHLLPHWFSYSIFQFLKKKIKRVRPGCGYKEMGKFIEKSHCNSSYKFQSFPSGHMGVSMALATSLFMEMNYSETPHFFEIPITSKITQKIISFVGLFVAIMVGIHRVSKGYHHIGDIFVGGIIGFCIGFISWMVLEYYKKAYTKLCEERENNNNKKDKKEDTLCDNYKYNKEKTEISYWLHNYNIFGYKFSDNKNINITIGIVRIILTIPIMYLLYKFLRYDVFKLSSIKH